MPETEQPIEEIQGFPPNVGPRIGFRRHQRKQPQ